MSSCKSKVVIVKWMEDRVAKIAHLFKTSTLSQDKPAFLLSTEWFSSWKSSVGYFCSPQNTVVEPIDNTPLMNKSELKTGLTEGIDYDIVTQEVWEQLSEWYDGGPEIRRPVEIDPKTGQCVVIVYPCIIEVHFMASKAFFEYSRFASVHGLKILACEHFKCAVDKSRLWDYFREMKQRLLEDSGLLCYYHIDETCPVLLETMNDNGIWMSPKQSHQTRKRTADSSKPGSYGLMNLGNTCYMNATLQSLTHIPSIVSFFENPEWKTQINVNNPLSSKGVIASLFAKLVNEMWINQRDDPEICPREFKCVFGDVIDHFADNQQHDAHEFLTFLMDIIHEDLNRVNSRDKPAFREITGDGSNDEQVSKDSWSAYKARNDSFIVDTFHGLYRSRAICPHCNQTTVVFDPYSSVGVPLPKDNVVTPPFLFVPYDLLQERLLMTVTISTDLTMISEVIESVSERIGRQVNLVFGERTSMSTDLSWKAIVATNLPENQLIAFELPEHDLEKVYAPVRLMVPNKTMNAEIAGFLLVELPNDNADLEAVQTACEKRFECLFKPSEGTIEDQKLKRIQSRISDAKVPFEENQKMRCTIVERSKRQKKTFERDQTILRVSNTRIDVLLNPAYLSEDTFCWSALRNTRNLIEKREKPTRVKFATIEDCLTNFEAVDTFDENNKVYCQHCNDAFRASKSIDLWSVPETLILHLKRFQCKGPYRRKIMIPVHYPHVLDLHDFVTGPQKHGDLNYSLHAVIKHDGGLAGGHYTADVYDPKAQKWYRCNDEKVKSIREKEVHSDNAYILFYCRQKKVQPTVTDKDSV